MKYTLQVAPEDCTGCGAVRRGLPGQGQDRTRSTRRINMAAAGAAPRRRARQLRLLPRRCPKSTARQLDADHGQGRAVAAAAVRVLRRLRRAAARRPTSSCSPSCSATG
ncbi:MAG: hypothetical protein MZV65_08760 [Chromatiales bacterium]|nr:hypothetical protein [Chromatiales bacterium]